MATSLIKGLISNLKIASVKEDKIAPLCVNYSYFSLFFFSAATATMSYLSLGSDIIISLLYHKQHAAQAANDNII